MNVFPFGIFHFPAEGEAGPGTGLYRRKTETGQNTINDKTNSRRSRRAETGK